MKRFKFYLALFLVVFMISSTCAQIGTKKIKPVVASRMRVIIDNDFCGDPDGLFQLAHHLLSPSVEIKAVIGSHLYKGGFYGKPGTAAQSCAEATSLLRIMQKADRIPVFSGADAGLTDTNTPSVSDGAKAIIQEAMKEDKRPLYVVCGAGLTTVASAYLMEPRITERIHLIWIGGPEYEGLALAPPKAKPLEYNLGIDIKAAQVIFNISKIPLWQVPRNAYRQALFSYAEIYWKLKDKGEAADFLMEKLNDLLARAGYSLGEAYVLGDSPLVLLTALQSAWEADASSSAYVMRSVPFINNNGLYEESNSNRNIRVYTTLDVRLMMDDFISKLALLNEENKLENPKK